MITIDPIKLTRTLIDIPSITGEEAEVGRFLADYLEKLKFDVEVQNVSAGRDNIIARTKADPEIVFSTHIDTVPPFIASSEDKEYIFGRGACDTKGIIASMISAAVRLRDEGEERIGFLFVVDEEMNSTGAHRANEHHLSEKCKFLINGEPTESRLAIGSKGSLRLRIKTAGRAAHSAYPELGESAIDKIIEVLQCIHRIEWPSDPFFGATTCNIGTISGGVRSNVIPSSASADLQIRLATDVQPIKELFETTVGSLAKIEYLTCVLPIRMLAVDGMTSDVVRFTTDVPNLTNWGEPLLFGPGSILVAHTDEERIAKRELTESIDIFIKLARKLLGTN
ncbi:MAG: M20/M25/M40 family metallo-hydrolase [Pyrinomonadaceae bacterium]